MIPKALIRLLARLNEEGAIPASHISESHRQALKSLFDSDVLTEVRKGRGCSVVVNRRDAFLKYLAKYYPEGFSEIGIGAMSRTEGVAKLRDSKQGRLISEVVMMSAKPRQVLVRGRDQLEVGDLTEVAQVASFVLEEGDQDYWQFTGRIASVENYASFVDWQQMGIEADVAIWTGGRISDRMIRWFSSSAMQGSTYLHCGDYDPVGLDEFLRLKESLSGGRVTLYIPEEIDTLFERYANHTLLANEKAAGLLTRLRVSKDPNVNRIVQLINKNNGGLEQEILLRRTERPSRNYLENGSEGLRLL